MQVGNCGKVTPGTWRVRPGNRQVNPGTKRVSPGNKQVSPGTRGWMQASYLVRGVRESCCQPVSDAVVMQVNFKDRDECWGHLCHNHTCVNHWTKVTSVFLEHKSV